MSSVPFIPKSIDDINAILVTVSSSLSLAGCLFILCIYIYYKELREFQLKLIFIMTINDLIISIIFLIATHVRPKFFDTLLITFPFLCNFPDSLLHYFFLSSFFWEVCIAHTLIQVIKYNNERVEENYKKYHIFSWGLSAFIIIGLFCLRNYSKADCHSDSVFPHLLFFIPLLAVWIYNLVVCVLLAKTFKEQTFQQQQQLNLNYSHFNNNNNIYYGNINDNKNSHIIINGDHIGNNGATDSININNNEPSSSSKFIKKTPNIIWTSIFFLFSFGFIWSWSILVIVLKYLNMDIKFVLMVSYLFVPLHGFMNAVCFGVNDRLRMNLKKSFKKVIYKIQKSLHLDQKKSVGERQGLFDYSNEDDDYFYPLPNNNNNNNSNNSSNDHFSVFLDSSTSPFNNNNNNTNINNVPYAPSRSNSITELLFNQSNFNNNNSILDNIDNINNNK